MSANVEQRRVALLDVAGERLRIASTPGTGTPLVICNDFVANLDILDDFAASLGRPSLCFDLPGVGGSDEVRIMRRMPALARLLARLLDHVGLEAPIDVLGIGWGGFLAQQFARNHRPRLRRLVLAATGNGQMMLPGRFASLWRLARPSGLPANAPDAERARQLFGGRRNDECEAVARAMQRARAPTRRGHAAQLYAVAGYSSLRWLHRLTVPALVVAGDDDVVVPPVNARVLALLLPKARFALIRGGGHWFVLERTSEVVRLLDEFLDARVAVVGEDQDNTL